MENFGKLKNFFNTILAEGISEKNDTKKTLFKKYIKMLKENKVLKTQFDAYTKIESMVEENEFKATEKIKKILESLKVYDKKVIYEANQKLFNLSKGRNIEDDYDSKSLHENISNLIFSNDVDTYVDSLHETVEFVKTNIIKEEVKGTGVPTSLLATIAVDKYNETYADLDESERKLIKSILEGNLEVREELFKENVNDCLNLINEKLKGEFRGEDVVIKESLLAAKENLLNRVYNNDTFEKDITKIINLKNNLI
jgi:hypothetical protein